jgi:peptide/nickel transport system substrate-binding protein
MLDQWDLAITSWTSDWQGNRARTTLGGWMDTDFAP